MSVELRPFGVACNISCKYCYQDPQRAAGNFRQHYDLTLMKAAVEREGGPFVLFGGEPLLMPMNDLEAMLEWGYRRYGGSSLQTNGSLLTPAHAELFKRCNVQVGVSIDGPGELNELRWYVNKDRTRETTELVMRNIAYLCNEQLTPGLIVTLHRCNAAPGRLPKLLAWLAELDELGIRHLRLHLLEAESPQIRADYGLSDQENFNALMACAELENSLPVLRFDIFSEMRRALEGRDKNNSCVWRSCDPYTTRSVSGVEGNGQSSNCGRTNKDGIDYLKADREGFERSFMLYRTPQSEGGCRDCRFFLMCCGQCPGTAIDGDWRNRSEFCAVWKQLFEHFERQAIASGVMPLSIHPRRVRLERQLLRAWSEGRNLALHMLDENNTAEAPDTLPAFVRRSFVGSRQAELWLPRIDSVRQTLIQLNLHCAADEIMPVVLVQTEADKLLSLLNRSAQMGLHSFVLPKTLPELPYLLPNSANRLQVAMGLQSTMAEFKAACAAHDGVNIARLLNIPFCCYTASRENTEDLSPDTDKLRWQINTLLHPVGISLLQHRPCSAQCRRSLTIAKAKLDRMAGLDPVETKQWLEAMLQWPLEWSSLHGIAEVKTGVLRFIHSAPYRAEKLSVRYSGKIAARDSATGLGFPYFSPKKKLQAALRSLPQSDIDQ